VQNKAQLAVKVSTASIISNSTNNNHAIYSFATHPLVIANLLLGWWNEKFSTDYGVVSRNVFRIKYTVIDSFSNASA